MTVDAPVDHFATFWQDTRPSTALSRLTALLPSADSVYDMTGSL